MIYNCSWIIDFTMVDPATNNTFFSFNLCGIHTREQSDINLDPSTNTFNGESWVGSVTVDSVTPGNPSWVTNNGLNLTVAPNLFSDRGVYTIKILITETGTGSWTMVPHFRELSITVSKRGPSINYNIPDYTDLRAGVSYEIIFPEPICKDPLDRPLEYSGLDSNGNSLPPYILLDLENDRIYGTAPTLSYGTITVRLLCFDEFAQSDSQLFNMVFNQNNNPVQHVTDFTPYTINVAEGMDSVYVFPQGKLNFLNFKNYLSKESSILK